MTLTLPLVAVGLGCGGGEEQAPVSSAPFAVSCRDPAALGPTDIGLTDEIDETCLEAGDPAFAWLGALATPSPGRCYTAPDRVELSADKALVLVTHLTTEFDRNAVLEGLAQQYLACQIADPEAEVVYLENTRDQAYRYYVRDLRPDYTVFSAAGEVPFAVPGHEVRIIGGYYSMCLQNTAADALIRMKGRDVDLTVTIVAPLIYTDGASGLADAASRPGLEALYRRQIVVPLGRGLDYLSSDAQRSFLRAGVDLALAFARQRGQATFPNHRIEIRFREQTVVVQDQSDPLAPTLRFDFEG